MELPYKFTAEQIILEGRTTSENLETIKKWISDLDDNVVPSKIQDEVIVLFLLSCSNDINSTKNTVSSYYHCKKNGPEIFDDRSMEKRIIQQALNTVHMASIPVRTDENYVIHFFKLNDPDHHNFDIVSIMKATYMLADISQQNNPPSGLIVVTDMEGLNLMHLTKFKLSALKKYFQFLQDGLPMQLKAIHFLNSVYFIDKVMALIKKFMKNELFNMFQLHPVGIEQEKLFQLIPKKCLPKEYGGDLPSEKDLHERTLKQFKEMQSFWDTEEKIRKQCK